VSAAQRRPRASPRIQRYLPLALLTTALVSVLPATLVAAAAPRGSLLMSAASGGAAVALSIAIATASAALWKRQARSRDILFADLLLWGWLRRCWTERRLSRAFDRYESAKRGDGTVSVDQLRGLGRLLEARDAYTHGHGQRVARHAERIAQAMHLSSEVIATIRAAAAVHDLGKLYTPREILNNPGRLTPEEFDVVKRHASDGADMLAGVGDAGIAAMVRHHHERIDGHGYPNGLAGSDIPIGARIIAVADTFDAITSNRAYRGAATQKKALEALSKGAGTQLDSVAVASFRHRYADRRSVAWLAVATAASQRLFAALQTASQSFGAGGGIAAILPALGTAGLLTLSPAHHQHGPGASAHSRAALVRSQGPTTAPRPSVHAPRRNTGRTSPNPTVPVAHRRRGVARTSPIRPTAGRPTASGPAIPTRRAGTSGGEPVAAGNAPPFKTGSPPPAGPTNPPPVNLPAVEGLPTVPPPPIAPPVSLPSVPGVSPPPVPAPAVPGTGLQVPSTDPPRTSLPPLG
jgi:HD-GYP domain-containing protein (c-di-GMP phosphodiesterase class II)